MNSDLLPLFPLNTVLFPGGPLPLKIFESRYVDMIADCLRSSSAFGVVLLATEKEGTSARLAATGCSAKIVDWDQGTDGLLYVTARGEQRFQLQAVSQQPDGLNVGEVIWLQAEPEAPPGSEHQSMAADLGRLLERNEGLYGDLEPRFDDASWIGYRLAELLPLSLATRQRCLELRDSAARLELLAPVLAKLRQMQAL